MVMKSSPGSAKILKAMRTVAKAMQRPGREVFAPIFQRLQRELEAVQAEEQAVLDAKLFLAGNEHTN